MNLSQSHNHKTDLIKQNLKQQYLKEEKHIMANNFSFYKKFYFQGLWMVALVLVALTQHCMAASAADSFIKFMNDSRGVLLPIGFSGAGTGIVVFIIMALSGRIHWKFGGSCVGVVLALLAYDEILSLVGAK